MIGRNVLNILQKEDQNIVLFITVLKVVPFLHTQNIQIVHCTLHMHALCMHLLVHVFQEDMSFLPATMNEGKVDIENDLISMTIRVCFSMFGANWTD